MPRGRPKGSRNKPKEPELKIAPLAKVKVQIISDIDKYEVKRAYWFMLALEKRIQVDPTSVAPSAYMQAVKNYTDRMRVYKDAKTKQRVDKKRSGQGDSKPSGTHGTSQDGSADLGARVPTVNPIT